MSLHIQTRNHLRQLQTVMEELDLWQVVPPQEKAFLSTEPFAIDSMTANEWLQWIFIPRMYALLECEAELPATIAISPYIEEALKETVGLQRLLSPIIEIERLLQNQ
ncbi:MAG TPA: anhydro-N-acetylmuramic acid kinase [Pasteurellaceae bacterium]|nr:anhydro-N-acetylmuramic acid kinase [Pasteurellaceae bacterium]